MSTSLASVVSQSASKILVACGLLAAALVVLALGVWYYRRRWIGDSKAGSLPWTFEEIRALRDRGDVTEQEYQVLRAQLLGMASRSPDAPKAVKPRGADPSGETVWSFDLKKTPPG